MLALVLLGAGLRLWQWAGEGSLWLDEIAVARNIEALTTLELMTGPLAFDQVAPAGFLAAVKLSTIAFGSSERALWLFPLICGLASLLVFRKLAERMLRGVAVPLAMGLFAIALPMIRYSAEVKQYGIDALATAALTLIALDLRAAPRTTGRLILAGLAGMVVIWFSHTSAMVMPGLGAALAIAWLLERDRDTARALLITMPLWAVGSLTALVVAEKSMTPSTRAFMHDFWRGGFLPLPPRPGTALPWLWERITGLYGDPWTLQYPLAWLYVLLAALGIAVLWRQRRDAALLTAGPFVLTLLVSAAQEYPFRQRLIVFLVPPALIAVAAGAGWLIALAARFNKAAAVAVAALAIAPPVWAIVEARIPARVDNYLPAYAYLQAHRQPGDDVYVSWLATSSALYYGPRYGLARNEFQVGACDRNDTRAYLRDADRFRGRKRVWVLMKNGPAVRVPNGAIRTYFGTIGVRRDILAVRSAVTDPLTLELFDLSDPARLRR
ncbi:MAG TPA: hypothetical protein VLV48_10370, partial [Thermoanaerobaculia bacterium]|nr:hypothetical protein [Thermoanaerobaculia bacterium]